MEIKVTTLFSKDKFNLGWLFVGGIKKYVISKDGEVLMIGARSVVKKYFDYLVSL